MLQRLRHFSSRQRVVVMLLFVFICVLVGAWYFGYYRPYQAAISYHADVDTSTKRVKESANRVAQSVWAPAFNDLTITQSISDKNMQTARQALESFEKEVAELQRISKKLPATSIVFSQDYVVAKSIQGHTEVITTQTKDVLGHYRNLLAFVSSVRASRAEYERLIAPLSKVYDINEYAGRSGVLYATSDSITKLAADLRAQNTPREMVHLRDSIVANYDATALGYANLARGIDVAIDDTIYKATAEIEAAVQDSDVRIPGEFDRAMNASPTLKEIQQLTDKFDAIE